jgi:hypothetical protein
MLDPKDIRVGNWVIRITGKDLNEKSFFEYKAIAVNEYYYTFAKYCFPIKLSPPVLDKCGFIQEGKDWYIQLESEETEGSPPSLRYKHKNEAWFLNEIKLPAQPAYLHQLQNLYYVLTGREVQILFDPFVNIDIVSPINFFIKPLQKIPLIRELL